MEIPEYFTGMSIRLSEVLNDSGASTDTVMERRETFLWRECMFKLACECVVECYHFGSQSEGATIPGLQSDIDFLYSISYTNGVNIMTIWEDWQAGILNLLMLHDDTMPHQQYLLQVIRSDTQEPLTRVVDENLVRTDSGKVLFSAERCKQDIQYIALIHGGAITNGPSVSWLPNWDIVQAFQVRKPLPEIQYWIDRCRSRHWPPAQLLEAAREAPCFLVPAGHPDSDYTLEEWRLSPNLIERMLMFSFNMTQIKCYIVLKLINKSLFAKLVGDSITSFHCKTIMFYTLARTQPCLWCKHNLMFLLRLCLNVFRTFLRLERLPHFILDGVNLFDGKLSKVQQRHLLVYIDSMIMNNLHDLFYIGIDTIGCRLQSCSIRRIAKAGELRRACLRNSISLLLTFECLERFRSMLLTCLTDNKHGSNSILREYTKYVLPIAFEYSLKVKLTNVALECIEHVYGFQNSIQASNCLRSRNVMDSVIISRFKYFFKTDVASSRLKLASILYCSGHMHAAVRVLQDVERRYNSKIKAVCGFRFPEGDRDLQSFANMLSGNSDKGFSEPPFAFCVNFLRHESYGTPFIMLFEMNRNITEYEIAQRNSTEKVWMGSAEVDARPFLHYLQYLTYGGLGKRDTQLHSLRVLGTYVSNIETIGKLHHLETALNLLGHCCEMERKYQAALRLYKLSLLYCDTNNAANWHVRRVHRLISG